MVDGAETNNLHRVRTTLWLLSALVSFAQPTEARAQTDPQQQALVQTIYGRVIDDRTRGPVGTAAVELLDSEGNRIFRVVTDTAGRFRFAPSAEGLYKLRAERIGYRTTESKEFRLLKGEQITFDFYISTQAVLLAPIEVRASTRAWAERYAGAQILPFYERKAFFEKLGTGKFFTRAQLADQTGLPLSTVLSTVAGVHLTMNGVTMRGASLRGDCVPQYYLNGSPMRLDPTDRIDALFAVGDLEAIEVYRGAAQLPAEFGGSTGECGAIVLWTRRTQ
jgi:hypothetical protein